MKKHLLCTLAIAATAGVLSIPVELLRCLRPWTAWGRNRHGESPRYTVRTGESAASARGV